MVQYPKYWRAKEWDKTPLGNVNKKYHTFLVNCDFLRESGTFLCSPIFWILYHGRPAAKDPSCNLLRKLL